MMLSESQERMLMVLEPEKEAVAKAIFVKWGLDFAIVGKTTDDLRFRSCIRASKSPTCRSRISATRRRNMTARGAKPTSARRCRPTSLQPLKTTASAAEARRLAERIQPPLGLRTV
jgi:phosphoribosylformylglycinamidine (FGAM) synthase-like enzyme